MKVNTFSFSHGSKVIGRRRSPKTTSISFLAITRDTRRADVLLRMRNADTSIGRDVIRLRYTAYRAVGRDVIPLDVTS